MEGLGLQVPEQFKGLCLKALATILGGMGHNLLTYNACSLATNMKARLLNLGS